MEKHLQIDTPAPWSRLASWLMPEAAGWVPLCLYSGVWAYALLSQRISLPSGQAVGLSLVLFALFGLERWRAGRYGAAQPPLRARIGLLLAQALLVEAAVQIEGFELSVFLYLIVPFSALLSFGSLAGTGIALLVWLLFAAKVLAADSLADALSGMAIFALAESFIVLLSLLVLRERQARCRVELLLRELHQAHVELSLSHKQLAAYAEGAAELATVRERNRLAREIHDSLGHALTALAIQLEQAQAFRLRDAQVADRAVLTAKQLADDALAAVRRSVGVLRLALPGSELAQALEALIAPLRVGLPPLALVIEGDPAPIAPPIQAALLRIVQEGLTNVRRHARARNVSVKLHCTNDAVRLTITDDGAGFDCATLPQRAGYGLQGIAERAALLGGTLDLTSAPGRGTTLAITLPIAGMQPISQASYHLEAQP